MARTMKRSMTARPWKTTMNTLAKAGLSALVVMGNITMLMCANAAGRAASDAEAVNVRIIGSSAMIAEGETRSAKTAFEAIAAMLDANAIPYSADRERTDDGRESVFIREVASERNWLYRVNGWTPPCTGINDYALSAGDTVELYNAVHQYATDVQLTSSQQSLNVGEQWRIDVLVHEPMTSGSCERPALPSWHRGEGVPIIIKQSSSTFSVIATNGTANIELTEPGNVTAHVWREGIFPSNVQSVNVLENGQAGEGAANADRQQQQEERERQEAQQAETLNKYASEKTGEGNRQQPEGYAQQPQGSGKASVNASAGNKNENRTDAQPSQENTRKAATLESSWGAQQLAQATSASSTPSQQQQPTTGTTVEQRQRMSAVLERAAQYLLDHRNADGLIGDASLNSWALLALSLLYDTDDGELADVIAAHEAHLASVDDLTALEAEKNILVASALKKNPKNFGGANIEERLRRYFDGEQIGDPRALNDDIWGIIALRSMDVPKEVPIIEKSRSFLLAHQNADGGFSYALDTASDADDTAACVMALLAAGTETTSEPIVRAFAFLDTLKHAESGGYRHRAEMENPSSVTTAWVIQALRAAGRPVPETAIAYIRDFQHDDGSFHAMSADEQTIIMTTALCLPALAGNIYPFNADPAPLVRSTETSSETDAQTDDINAEGRTNGVSERSAEEQSGSVLGATTKESPACEAPSSDSGSDMERLKYGIATLERNILRWKRANAILLGTIITMSVGAIAYALVFHTSIMNRRR